MEIKQPNGQQISEESPSGIGSGPSMGIGDSASGGVSDELFVIVSAIVLGVISILILLIYWSKHHTLDGLSDLLSWQWKGVALAVAVYTFFHQRTARRKLSNNLRVSVMHAACIAGVAISVWGWWMVQSEPQTASACHREQDKVVVVARLFPGIAGEAVNQLPADQGSDGYAALKDAIVRLRKEALDKAIDSAGVSDSCRRCYADLLDSLRGDPLMAVATRVGRLTAIGEGLHQLETALGARGVPDFLNGLQVPPDARVVRIIDGQAVLIGSIRAYLMEKLQFRQPLRLQPVYRTYEQSGNGEPAVDFIELNS